MNTEALTQLLRVLNEVAELEAATDKHHFSLDSWFGGVRYEGQLEKIFHSLEHGEKEKTVIDTPQGIPHQCGTTACACGYAGLDPWFREKGFKTTPKGGILYTKNFDTGWEAVRIFFDLSYYQAEYLFTAAITNDIRPEANFAPAGNSLRETIARVARFIEEGGKIHPRGMYLFGLKIPD